MLMSLKYRTVYFVGIVKTKMPHKFIVTSRIYIVILTRDGILIEKINIISKIWPELIYAKIADHK
jgi:hypothetical protein